MLKKQTATLSHDENILLKIERNLDKIKKEHPSKIEWKEIRKIQEHLRDLLDKETRENIKWKNEELLDAKRKDKVDVLGEYKDNLDKLVIIEIDSSRADQVAKKFVSRMALTLDKEVLYISVCCQGCDKNNKKECEKYFEYCEILANCLSESGPKKTFRKYFLE